MVFAGEIRSDAQREARANARAQWLEQACGLPSTALQAMRHDASFRRYFRLLTATGSFVVMDAPPPTENCRPYVAIAKALRAMGLQTPEILQADLEQGFLLITDFGDTTYLDGLTPHNAAVLYERALSALSVLQGCRDTSPHPLPFFNEAFMQQEWAWHKEWFLNRLLALSPAPELDACFTLIAQECVNQPQVFMHRDYHSGNLMVMQNNVGILDFQDAFIGPVTYDLVSLLRDCYVDWPQEQVTAWALSYFTRLQKLNVLPAMESTLFLRWFDFMGLERHLKALFTFARKHVRDQQSNYLAHIPRVLNYIIEVSARYPQLRALHDYYRDTVQPAFIQFQKGRA